jgi:glycosyltransferase involved in cell wall biosynthesis
MRILFSSYAFRPSIGGIETVSEILANEFSVRGHEVRLITQTPGDAGRSGAGYRVIRRPRLPRLLTLLRWSDVFFQNNISLRSLLPALTMQKHTIVVHQTWIRNMRGQVDLPAQLKRMSLGMVANVAISRVLAEDIARECMIIPNPYRDDLFRLLPEVERKKTLVFLGRLVSDKGVDLLLRALALLQREGSKPDLTIIGAGPEAENLSALARELALAHQVSFVGEKTGEELVRLLNQHRIMVVPSRWVEPFGVVALEGIACGCVVIGSQDGGLKEAIGPCGMTFENGNERALADALKRMLQDRARENSCRDAPSQHLAKFKAREIAHAYLGLMEQVVL